MDVWVQGLITTTLANTELDAQVSSFEVCAMFLICNLYHEIRDDFRAMIVLLGKGGKTVGRGR